MLAGRFQPTQGDVLIRGKPATRLRTYERARLGLGMKLQIPCVFTELSVRENLWLAGYAAGGQKSQADTISSELVDWLGFALEEETLAGNLSHGQQQALEIAMVVATAPPVILLDEPTAGMTHGETSRVAALVRALSKSSAVLVIEHDMDFVRALDCPIVLMVDGQVFAKGSLDELRQDTRVLDVYLGRTAQNA
jgi:branched-chain amino acid transport system permease protein